jgi:hypothetical protein
MSITKLATVGSWAQAQTKQTTRDLAHVTAGKPPRIITGMLTGSNADLYFARTTPTVSSNR